MRKARRERFITAAQVAYHYGAYTLDDAMTLSRGERELLLAVVLGEEERLLQRLETILGTSWDAEDLIQAAVTPDPNTPEHVSARVRIPMLTALAPEMMKKISDTHKSKFQAAIDMLENVPQGNRIMEVGTLSKNDAKAFFQRMAAVPEAPPEPKE